jgi:hypothetical protein
MPLQMKKGRLDKPSIVCDHCGAEIGDGTVGTLLSMYDPTDGTPKGAIYFTHHECSAAFTEQSAYPWWRRPMDLDCLPVCLAQSLNIDWNEAQRKVQWLNSLPD